MSRPLASNHRPLDSRYSRQIDSDLEIPPLMIRIGMRTNSDSSETLTGRDDSSWHLPSMEKGLKLVEHQLTISFAPALVQLNQLSMTFLTNLHSQPSSEWSMRRGFVIYSVALKVKSIVSKAKGTGADLWPSWTLLLLSCMQEAFSVEALYLAEVSSLRNGALQSSKHQWLEIHSKKLCALFDLINAVLEVNGYKRTNLRWFPTSGMTSSKIAKNLRGPSGANHW